MQDLRGIRKILHPPTDILSCNGQFRVRKNGATVTANLLIGLGIDEFFTRTDSAGVRALLPDALGSTVALGDNTGTLQTHYTYEPFGFTTQTGAASTNSYKFTGREDDGTGLFYYRARYYQPRFQRFIAEDPIRLSAGTLNIYEFVTNNPTNRTDALGLETGAVTTGVPPFREPEPLPYDPLRGPTAANCSIYSNDPALRYLCQDFFSNRPSTNCTRSCLQVAYPGASAATLDRLYYLIPWHLYCFNRCSMLPWDFCPGNDQ